MGELGNELGDVNAVWTSTTLKCMVDYNVGRKKPGCIWLKVIYKDWTW
jgi:hypothetical protein